MAKTWYGHHIENIKGEDYVLFKDYLELDKEIERLNNIIDELGSYCEKELKNPADYIFYDGYQCAIRRVISKIKELKEGK